MPAAVPALVMTGSSSTHKTDGSTLAAGQNRASWSACRQCVVHRLSSSSPAAASTNAPLQAEWHDCHLPARLTWATLGT